jgi:hypothetical protein
VKLKSSTAWGRFIASLGNIVLPLSDTTICNIKSMDASTAGLRTSKPWALGVPPAFSILLAHNAVALDRSRGGALWNEHHMRFALPLGVA